MKRYSNIKVLAFVLLGIYLLFQFFILRLYHSLLSADISVADRPGIGMGIDAPTEITIDLEEEIKNSLKYVKSIQSTERKLVFVHIPKTAGTTIEEVGGLQAKVAWGSCLFNHRPKRRGGVCKYPPGQFEWPMKIGYWHLPTQLFPLKGINPYDGADLFAVVRDPDDRLLSEFLYICRKKVTKWADTIECNSTLIHEPAYMNKWLRGKMKRSSSTLYQPKDYLDLNGHFTPQYDFVVAHGDIRMVDYVLRMDNLQEEFPSLMQAYGVNAVMSSKKRNVARNDTRDLEPKHFDETTRGRVQDTYMHDFDLLANRKS
jgi:hypothetical protein